ncbi:adapter protein MecA [Paucilactobacillus hokkaidonensis JCM 18461]|uniref:Adapter protein MecA n=1 Tax=Paucilactobacillus hokkaidonensis JCM 18461 TaxID=1291742 RepID=A0A0A1GZU7_9LACO|nr:adaptor protein MecA [Paucilactobacillus hokkaidonensis]BAP85996.1 adapter protein MecA [Paucilactobacillus hokkaidonensis JCM 18461]
MEMERINENTIRVLIGNDDLTQRGITVLDLLGNHQQIESFFYSILEEVDTEHQFQDNDSVTFQVLPNRNGLELFISKNGIDEEVIADQADDAQELQTDDISDFLKRQLEQTDGKHADQRKSAVGNDELDSAVNDQELEKSVTVIKLADFENMVQIARILHLENAISNLYTYRDSYYLEIIFFVDQTTPETIKDELAVAYEYGDKAAVTSDVLNEHGKKVMDNSALELTRFYFSK